MAQANPPPHVRLPPEILKNRPLAEVLQKIVFDVFLLWKKTGGSTDDISDSLTNSYEFDDLEQIDVKNELKKQISTQNSDYTTYTSETVICTDAITVFLNASPEDGEIAQIKITNGDVTIDGNGRFIDGNDKITFEFDAFIGQPMVDCYYSIETDSWYII